VTANAQYLAELNKLVGHYMTPTIVLDGQVLIGFGPSFQRIEELLAARTGAKAR